MNKKFVIPRLEPTLEVASRWTSAARRLPLLLSCYVLCGEVIHWINCIRSYTWTIDRPPGEHKGLHFTSFEISSDGWGR